MSGFSLSMFKVSKMFLVRFLVVQKMFLARFLVVWQSQFKVGIFIEIVGNVSVITFFGAEVVFGESHKQIAGSLTNVVAAA